MIAKYDGRCTECRQRYPEGTSIRRTDDGWGHANSDECEPADADPLPPAKYPICPGCFLEQSATGSCGCD